MRYVVRVLGLCKLFEFAIYRHILHYTVIYFDIPSYTVMYQVYQSIGLVLLDIQGYTVMYIVYYPMLSMPMDKSVYTFQCDFILTNAMVQVGMS